MTRDEEKDLLVTLQDFLQDQIVVVVGSGYSGSHGIPGMTELATYLNDQIPRVAASDDQSAWNDVSNKLATGDGLEASLQSIQVSSTLLDLVTAATTQLIDGPELNAIKDVISGKSYPKRRHSSSVYSESVPQTTYCYSKL
jgi:hypothetical protein